MEGMLKSAVAETTKLFETMVDELKAEISKIKKENEDLKRKCSQFEKATTNGCNETESNPRKSDSCEKRDTAIQCGESYNTQHEINPDQHIYFSKKKCDLVENCW